MSHLFDDDLPEPEREPWDMTPVYPVAPVPRPIRPVAELVAELGRPATQRELLSLVDEEELLAAIAEGVSLDALCKSYGVRWLHLHDWLTGDTGRRGRFERARRVAAQMFEERAELVLRSAPGTIAELSRAKALASLMTRRASIYDPDTFGERKQVQVTHDVIGELKDRIHAAARRLPLAPTPLLPRVDDSGGG